MKKLGCAFFLFSAFLSHAQKNTDSRFAGLDAAVHQILKDWHAAGVAVAVVEKNKIVYQKGFGYRDVEKKLPVTSNTLFAIGSCTKAFTAALMGLLQKDGKVDFDKPAQQYLPSLRFYNDAMNNGITLRDMMSHRTGLPRYDLSWYFFNTSSRDSLLGRIRYQEPNAGVRDKWQYNNFMFMAQGAVAEKLLGKSWEEVIKEKFFVPLGMHTSNFTIADLQKSSEAALGYGVKNDSLIKKLAYYNINGMEPAGAINSSVAEMSNWVITWINGGTFGAAEILPATYVTEAISPQAIVGPGLPAKERPDVFFSAYGFGWFLSSYRGHYRVEHGGNINGFSASTSFFPTDSIGIIVLTNQNASAVPSIVRNMLSDRMLHLKPYNWNGDLKKESDKAKAASKAAMKTNIASAKATTKPTHPLKDYEGSYNQPGFGAITIFAKGDSLFARTPEQVLWLRHDNYDVFEPFEVLPGEAIDTTDTNPGRLQFGLSKTGAVETLTEDLEPGIKPIVFTRQLAQQDVAKADLQKYVGAYELSGITVKVYIKGEKTLYVFVPGQPEYELAAQGGDKFALKALNGYFVQFALNARGAVTDVTFIQPNGSFKAVRK